MLQLWQSISLLAYEITIGMMNKVLTLSILRKTRSRPEILCKKVVLKNITKFEGKLLCRSLFFDKVAGLQPSFIEHCLLFE